MSISKRSRRRRARRAPRSARLSPKASGSTRLGIAARAAALHKPIPTAATNRLAALDRLTGAMRWATCSRSSRSASRLAGAGGLRMSVEVIRSPRARRLAATAFSAGAAAFRPASSPGSTSALAAMTSAPRSTRTAAGGRPRSLRAPSWSRSTRSIRPTRRCARAPWPLDASAARRCHGHRPARLLLGILTADCAPVLLADPEAGVIGAAHAGWRGALAGVTDSTIAAMEQLGARREHISAAVGPCIAQASLRGRRRLPRRASSPPMPAMRASSSTGPRASRISTSKLMSFSRLDRRRHRRGRGARPRHLCRRGSLLFSFRRATHRGEADYGRQLSAIALPWLAPRAALRR